MQFHAPHGIVKRMKFELTAIAPGQPLRFVEPVAPRPGSCGLVEAIENGTGVNAHIDECLKCQREIDEFFTDSDV